MRGGQNLKAISIIDKRLLSYHHITENTFGSTIVFNAITGETYADKKNRVNSRPRTSKAGFGK